MKWPAGGEVLDAPVQTNAADPEQVKVGQDAETLARRQAIADVRAEIADQDARRRCWPIVRAVLTEAVRPQATDEACREYCVEQRILKFKVVQWMQHREFFLQMVGEGLKRDADESTMNAARHVKGSR